VIEFLRPIPPIAWIPLAIFWFGIGNLSAGFIVFLGAFFPVFVNSHVGIRSVERVHIEAALTLGASRKLLITDVLIPAAIPHLLAGIRIGLGFGWMAVVAAELIAANSGLGYDIGLNRNLLRTDRILAGMATIGFIGYGMNLGMERLGRLLLPWQANAK
jgi:ABC-type nitrate/sulfonate/bicarbonate transport system permease component